MDSASHSLSGVLQDFALRIPVEWMVRILVVISMLLQLVLVVLGPRRYYISSGIFRLVVWGAYISADAVAISAFGTMMHNAGRGIYGIWAPVLLLHLGGPDAITAYSMADNELWLRHAFNMVYQVSVAVHVMYSSALEGHALASAILLLVAGVIKYGERILALWLGTYSQIVSSCLPIAKYMKDGNVVQRRGYVVMGENQLNRMIENEAGASSKAKANKEAGTQVLSLEGREIITMQDVENANIQGKDYNLCLSHALFKMYKRRFVSLPFEEGDRPETKDICADKLTGLEAFRIAEMELKFMYDAIFSKWRGAAFSKWGIAARLLNTTLVGVSGFLILKGEYSETQRTVTYVVISVALVVEVFQFCRIMISDWTRVNLICARVDEMKWCRSCRMKVLEIAEVVLDKIQNVVGGNIYRNNGIHQHCLMETCLNSSPFVWKIAELLPKDNFVVNGYIKARHIHKVSVEEDLKVCICDILQQALDFPDKKVLKIRIYEEIIKISTEIKSRSDNLEEVILLLHVATTICDMKRILLGEEENKNVRLSRIMSRYCAYLLLSRPNLLPLHPDMTRIAYLELVERLLKIQKSTMGVLGKHSHSQFIEAVSVEAKALLGAATNLARELLGKEENRRWKSLVKCWSGLVIYIACYNKATFHAECLATGGEFLSQVWVLLGHLGCGEQSDSAVKVKVEASKGIYS
ncbi:hypothetical protein SUGI_0341980 [Cryptomeria japonica]|nr:hypothetical protein SUGI_0341980 [Cryptomeria japonica]